MSCCHTLSSSRLPPWPPALPRWPPGTPSSLSSLGSWLFFREDLSGRVWLEPWGRSSLLPLTLPYLDTCYS